MEQDTKYTNDNNDSVNNSGLERGTITTDSNRLQNSTRERNDNEHKTIPVSNIKPKRQSRSIKQWFIDTRKEYIIDPLQKKIDAKYKKKILLNLSDINKEWSLYRNGKEIDIYELKDKEPIELAKILEETLIDIEETID